VSVLVCLLPSYVDVPEPDADLHCTIVWGGDWASHAASSIETLKGRCEFIARHFAPIEALVTGVDTFGQGVERTPVLRLEHAHLYAMRVWCEQWNRSEYKEYRPHLSVSSFPSVFPKSIRFDRIALWLGDSRITENVERSAWRLGTGVPCAA
jgi:hypothetical protein